MERQKEGREEGMKEGERKLKEKRLARGLRAEERITY